MRGARLLAASVVAAGIIACAAPASASAAGPAGVICGLAGLVDAGAHTACNAVTHPRGILSAGSKVIRGGIGGLVKDATTATARAGAAVIVSLAVGAAQYLLKKTATVIGTTTRPNLTSTWFSASYWRMAAVSALLTLPFLFAAAIQAIVRSDLALLARAAFGYLPLGLLAVAIAAPVTMLLLSASDEMSAIVASASGHADASFLGKVGVLTGLADAGLGTEFVAFFVALLTVAATVVLWIEMLIRDAAIYVIVLMLPLFFAAMVWPARRIWATRSIELLVALIMSKFAIVAVLSLGGAALGHALIPGPASILSGATLVLLAAFAPWALLRLLPLHELASAAVGGVRVQATGELMNSARNVAGLAERAGETGLDLVRRPPPGDERPPSAEGRDGATNSRPQPESADGAGPGVVATGVHEAAAAGPEDGPPEAPTVISEAASPDAPSMHPPELGDGMEEHWKAPWETITLGRESADAPSPQMLTGGKPPVADRPTQADQEPSAPADPEPPPVDLGRPPLPPQEDEQ